MTYVLYNPLSGNGEGWEKIRSLREGLSPKETLFRDIRELGKSPHSFFEMGSENDRWILAGGDGTLHRFVNAIPDSLIPRALFLYPTGNENRFYHRHISEWGNLLPLTDRISRLPTLTVGKASYRVLNGVGVGLDAYLREQQRRQSRVSEEVLSPAEVQIRGLLLAKRRFSAEVVVDGTATYLSDCRSLSVAHGTHTEGGLRILPELRRTRTDDPLGIASICGFRGKKISRLLPSLLREELPKDRKLVWTSRGRMIRVRLSRPQALAVDGELLDDVTEFTVVL